MPTGPPLYWIIADELSRDIESGRIPRGGRLPGGQQLAERFDASRNTVRQAIKLLISRRLVESRQGQGIFAVESPRPYTTILTGDPGGGGEGEAFRSEVERAGREARTGSLCVEVRQADDAVAEALHLSADAEVVTRAEQRFIDGRPWSVQTSYYPMCLVERGARDLARPRDIPQGTAAYLMETLGIRQAAYRDSVRARPPSEAETAFFGLPPDERITVLDIFRIAYGEDGEPFRVTVAVYPADRNRFIANIGSFPEDGRRHRSS